jgi:hypothetical protein
MMARSFLIAAVIICELAVAQNAPAPKAEQKAAQAVPESGVRHVRSGSGVVAVDPKQPYRPIPANRVQARETIYEFYRKALNPRQIKWGDEIDRRLAALAEQSVGNPYFRLCALQMALILVLLLTCWLWWDKMHQIKWLAAECLTDAINAKRIADHKALEAIGRYNCHIEMCNRVIENQQSGIATGDGSGDLQAELRKAETQLAAERAKVISLEAEIKNRDDIQKKLDARLEQLEKAMPERQGGANAELVARLQRAEAELSNRKTHRS